MEGSFDLCEELGWDNKQKKLILRYALRRVERSHRKEMYHDCPNEEIKWSTKSTRWWKSDSVFLCFSNKQDDDDLLEELQRALYDWSPNPSRLFLASLRAIMDEHGVVSQKDALENEHALAFLVPETIAGERLRASLACFRGSWAALGAASESYAAPR